MNNVKKRILSANRTYYQTPSIQNKKKKHKKLPTEGSLIFNKPDSFIKKQSSSELLNNSNLKMSQSVPKQPQQIRQQNLNLKKFINELKNQLSDQRLRTQINKRKSLKYVSQINREFQKQLYYSGKNPNSYMITGVKNQYEKMKAKFQEKQQELQQLIKQPNISQNQQLLYYIEALEGENKLLKQKIEARNQLMQSSSYICNSSIKSKDIFQKQSYYNRNILQSNSQDSQLLQDKQVKILINLLSNQRQKFKTSQTIIASYSEKIKVIQESRNELIKKIQFLQKVMIQKDNNQHQAKRNIKLQKKQKNQLHKKIIQLQELIKSNDILFQKKILKQKEQQQKRFFYQIEIFKKSITLKDQQIHKLQKQIRFLSTMLSYWKPLDQINRQFHGIQNKKQQQKAKLSIGEDDQVSQIVKKKTLEGQHDSRLLQLDNSHIDQFNIRQSQHNNTNKSQRQEEPFKRANTMRSQSANNVTVISKYSYQDCSRKHSTNAKKVRKIDINTIKPIGQLIRYRVIGSRVNINEVKQLFQYKYEIQRQEDKFLGEYMTMRQIKNIFLCSPFDLNQEEALIISRYIVQDSPNQFVYEDQGNQVSRNIAKSIIKTVIGEYKIIENQVIHQQWAHISKLYKHNITSALKTIAPKGLVSSTKLLQLIVGLGIQCSDELKEWIIGVIVIKSRSLDELKYSILFDQ